MLALSHMECKRVMFQMSKDIKKKTFLRSKKNNNNNTIKRHSIRCKNRQFLEIKEKIFYIKNSGILDATNENTTRRKNPEDRLEGPSQIIVQCGKEHGTCGREVMRHGR